SIWTVRRTRARGSGSSSPPGGLTANGRRDDGTSGARPPASSPQMALAKPRPVRYNREDVPPVGPPRGAAAVKRRLAPCCLLTLSALLLSPIPAARADNWPQWRGPTLDGISKETNLPTEWDATKNVAWTLPLPGRGGSTPAVWGDRIFLTSEDGK